MTITPATVADLRSSVRHVPRHFIGGLTNYPIVLIPAASPGDWVIYTNGHPRCCAPLPIAQELIDLDREGFEVLLDATIDPEEACLDHEARAIRQRGREGGAALARARIAEQEAAERAADFKRREVAAIRRIDPTTVDLDSL